MRTADQIIEALGGTGSVAKKLNVSLPAVSNWRARGLPPGRGLDIAELARELRSDVTVEEIRAATIQGGGAV